MNFWWILVGAVLAGPIWVAVSVWAGRRVWRNALRLTARTKGQSHLIEVGQLVGGLAHEIKNPLSTINVNLKLLSEDIARYLDEDHRRLGRRLSSVQIEADRLKDILDDFLRYAGRYELTLTSVDLRRVIEELADFFSPQGDAAGVVLRLSLQETPLRSHIDVNLIKQAILNLMINAVDAMPDGGELLLKVSSERDNALIEVIDTGVGIAPDELEKIFEVYFSSRKQGTGLGLPTTRRIIREHGGTLQVESELGTGTRFVVSLPLEKT